MRKWIITRFGLTIVGCWLLVDGIRNRIELLDNTQVDSTEVPFTENVELTGNLIPTATSAVLVDSVENAGNNTNIVNTGKETKQDSKSPKINSKSQHNSRVKDNLTISDFRYQLSGNSYQKILVESLIEDGWESG